MSKRGVAVVIALAATAGVVSACGGSAGNDRGDEQPVASGVDASGTTSGATASVASTSPATANLICPATGAWQICSVVERLERAGLAPRREPGEAREPPLSTRGVAFMLGRSELRVFLYADRASRERDQAKLDTTKYTSASEPLSMSAEPTLIASENLLAILRSRSDHQRERVSDALTAGPPQSPGTKE
ncbi:MAG: hypothetical protein ABR499_01210 [Gemmatimonadaceae bacterium]